MALFEGYFQEIGLSVKQNVTKRATSKVWQKPPKRG